MRYITKAAVIKLLKTFFPTKKNFEVRAGKITGWVYVKIDNSSPMGPYELYKETGIDLRDFKLCGNNLDSWRELVK